MSSDWLSGERLSPTQQSAAFLWKSAMSQELPEPGLNSFSRLSDAPDDRDLFRQLHEHLATYDQAHLLNHWASLTASERLALAEQVRALDLNQLSVLWKQAGAEDTDLPPSTTIRPPESISPDQNSHGVQAALNAGEEMLRNGEVGVLIVAGGEGSRLGFAQPKGCFPIGPVRSTPLFQIFLEKTLAASRKYGVTIPVYVMTSPTTHHETTRFLNEADWFGIPSEARHVFCQGTLPAVDFKNQILMAGPSQLSLSPDGHGGILPALVSSGLLETMQRRGVEHLFYCQIDNAAAPVPDPVLVGLHGLEQSEVTILVTEKHSPRDRVGTVVSLNDRLHILEYTLIPESIATQRDENGSLRYRSANTGIHLLSRNFLARCASQIDLLPFHRAIKTVSHVDSNGNQVVPDEPNAVKFERFIFDLFPQAQKSLLIDVDAESAFIPLKDARSTETSPASVRRKLSRLYRRWFAEAGMTIPDGVTIEISPLFAANARELRDRLLNSRPQLNQWINSSSANGTLYLSHETLRIPDRISG